LSLVFAETHPERLALLPTGRARNTTLAEVDENGTGGQQEEHKGDKGHIKG